MVVGFLMTWRKLPWKKRFSLWQILVIKKETQECPLKSEAHQNTSGPSSEVTKTKLKERLEGKDTAVIFSEDDDNNSFCINQKDKTKQQKILGRFLKHLTKMKDVERTLQLFLCIMIKIVIDTMWCLRVKL